MYQEGLHILPMCPTLLCLSRVFNTTSFHSLISLAKARTIRSLPAPMRPTIAIKHYLQSYIHNNGSISKTIHELCQHYLSTNLMNGWVHGPGTHWTIQKVTDIHRFPPIILVLVLVLVLVMMFLWFHFQHLEQGSYFTGINYIDIGSVQNGGALPRGAHHGVESRGENGMSRGPRMAATTGPGHSNVMHSLFQAAKSQSKLVNPKSSHYHSIIKEPNCNPDNAKQTIKLEAPLI